MTDIISKLNAIWRDDDHERGCQGRSYSCSCGFDERTFETAKEAAEEIQRLREERAAYSMAYGVFHTEYLRSKAALKRLDDAACGDLTKGSALVELRAALVVARAIHDAPGPTEALKGAKA